MSPQARTGTAKADEDEDEKDAKTSSGEDEGVTEPDGSNAHTMVTPDTNVTPIEPPEGSTTFMTAEEAEKQAEKDEKNDD